MRAQLSLEFSLVLSLILLSSAALAALPLKTESLKEDQQTALLIDDLSSFGSPFRTEIILIDVNLKNHRVGDAITITEELFQLGGYRYRTHSIKGPVLP